jgi:hypothetical protein
MRWSKSKNSEKIQKNKNFFTFLSLCRRHRHCFTFQRSDNFFLLRFIILPPEQILWKGTYFELTTSDCLRNMKLTFVFERNGNWKNFPSFSIFFNFYFLLLSVFELSWNFSWGGQNKIKLIELMEKIFKVLFKIFKQFFSKIIFGISAHFSINFYCFQKPKFLFFKPWPWPTKIQMQSTAVF